MVIVQKRMIVLFLAGMIMVLFTGCIQEQNSKISISQTKISDSATSKEATSDSVISKETISDSLAKNENITQGTDYYQGFIIDNILHSEKNGDIHYNVYIPDEYDGSRPYALYFTLPGYEGLYFQGIASNLKAEAFGFEAQKYNQEMIIVAPQLSDWGDKSANQTIDLVEYFFENYNIDRSKVYANGYSGGGGLFAYDAQIMGWLFNLTK